MDYDKLEAAITEKTKAIIPVDLGGIVCDYDKIFEIVERNKNLFTPLDDHSNPLADLSSRIQKAMGRVAVVADCAHSLGASRIVGGQKLYCGAVADFSSFSFHAVKNFTTAEGGAAAWRAIPGIDNAEIYKFYQLLSLHGQNKDALAKTQISAWEYDIIGAWYKCNMTDIIACNTVITNLFYGYGNTKTPMIISIVNLTVNVILNLVLIHFLGVNGLALATSLSAIITFFVRIKLAEKYVSLDNKQMIVTGIKVLIASAIACMIPRTIFWIHPINIYLTLVISSLLGVAIYLGVVKMLKVHEINDLIELLKRKFKKTLLPTPLTESYGCCW